MPGLRLEFHGNRQPLLAVGLQRKRNPAADRAGRITGFQSRLDILRIIIQAANDDHLLATPGNVQFAAVNEPQVAGPQERLRP